MEKRVEEMSKTGYQRLVENFKPLEFGLSLMSLSEVQLTDRMMKGLRKQKVLRVSNCGFSRIIKECKERIRENSIQQLSRIFENICRLGA